MLFNKDYCSFSFYKALTHRVLFLFALAFCIRLDLVAKLPNASDYNTFAYHTPLLKEFVDFDSGGGAKRRSSKNGGDHTNPRVLRRGTYMSDKLVQRTGSLRELTSQSDGDEPKGKGSFRNVLDGSNHGPRARRLQYANSTTGVPSKELPSGQ